LRHIADQLRGELPDCRVWVGGAAFALEHEGWPDEEILDLPAIAEAARLACLGPNGPDGPAGSVER
jgi:hypothetical protein